MNIAGIEDKAEEYLDHHRAAVDGCGEPASGKPGAVQKERYGATRY
jgi:hypothetical protein